MNMNKCTARFLFVFGLGVAILGMIYGEVHAQNLVTKQVVANDTVHFGNLATENKNLFVTATNPPRYIFDVENVSHSDTRVWKTTPRPKGMIRPGCIKHWSEKIDTSKEVLRKVYNPVFSGTLISQNNQKGGVGPRATWELTGAFVVGEPDFEIEICSDSNASDIRNEFGVGERFKVNAVIKSEAPRYRGELTIKSVTITKNMRQAIELIKPLTGYRYQIGLLPYQESWTTENDVRKETFNVVVKVDISGNEYVKNTSITVYSPKLISKIMEPYDFRPEMNATEMHGAGFWLKRRILLPENVSYNGLWIGEGKCPAVLTGFCKGLENMDHEPGEENRVDLGDELSDRCSFYFSKNIFLHGEKGSVSWRIPQYLSLSSQGTQVIFAYLTQTISCEVIRKESIDETIDGARYVHQRTVRFTL